MKRLALLALLAVAATDAPRVELLSPRGGWTARRVVPIAGTVSDASLRLVRLSVNGRVRTVNASDGRFEAKLPVRAGVNIIEAAATSLSGTGRARVQLRGSAPPADLQVELTWDTNGTDLDLRVTEPGGEECYYGNRFTAAEGSLAVDDTDGFGPEIYVLPVAPMGEYRIAVAYFDAGAATQTDARVDVVLREGSPDEQRMSFPVTLTRADETLEVATVRVGPPFE